MLKLDKLFRDKKKFDNLSFLNSSVFVLRIKGFFTVSG